jgi:hypothetical protein
MKKSWIVSALMAALLIGCAEERPTERIADPNGYILDKQTFIGGGANDDLSANAVGDDSQAYWFQKVTVVNTSANGGFAFVGYQSDLKVGFFDFSEKQLKFYNAVTPYGGKRPAKIVDVDLDGQGSVIDEVVKNELINAWDVEHFEPRLATSDGKTTNREEDNKYLRWEEKTKFKVKWDSSRIAEAASFPFQVDAATLFNCWQKVGSELVPESVEVSPDYIGFTIAVDYRQVSLCNGDLRRYNRGDYTFTAHYKYSFKRFKKSDLDQRAYQPYVYTGEKDPLTRKYGYFKTVLEQLGVNGRFKNIFLMNRWNPNKTHDIYFAPDFPEKWKDVFANEKYGVIARTNKVLKENGIKMRFRMLENDGSKKFGDLRYSFIKFIDTIDPGAPLGYGPSDANPFTGEIISANTMIWTGYLRYYLERINGTFSRREEGRYGTKLFQAMQNILNGTIEDNSIEGWLSTAEPLHGQNKTAKAYDLLLPRMTYGYPAWNSFTQRDFPGLVNPGEAKLYHSPLDKQLYDFRSTDLISDLMRRDSADALTAIRDAQTQAKRYIQGMSRGNFHHRDTTVYPINQSLIDARGMYVDLAEELGTDTIDGASLQKIVDTIVYRVAIHEFGHNLNLRHNFYGSVDEKNFADPIVKNVVDKDGKTVPRTYQQATSSVMEYLALQDEIHLDKDWEAYDKAALAYAYSGGKVDHSLVDPETGEARKKRFLFCTDEHRALNAMCNTWDRGSTPSEIVLNIIENYDDSYWVNNRRFGRAYWDTTGYESRIFGTMFSLKKFLMAWRSGFHETDINHYLSESGQFNGFDIKEVTTDIHKDFKQAVKLSIAFYNSVLQTPANEKHYRSQYDEWTGALERVGIAPDKVFAMMMLMGDEGFMYNPNRYYNYASYITFKDTPELTDLLEKVLDNTVTLRVDMDPWFIGFGRLLYAINAYNFTNLSDASHIHKIRVGCYTADRLKDQLGIDPENFVEREGLPAGRLDSGLVDLSKYDVQDDYFKQRADKVGVVRISDRFYVASELQNPYSYNIIWNMIQQPRRFGNSLGTAKDDIKEVYQLFHLVTQQRVPECL